MTTPGLDENGNQTILPPDTIWTYSGRPVRPLHPSPDDFDIADIAHALSNICRFTGHVRSYYSVAEHCVHVATLVPTRAKRAALLHDGSEAYLSDLARPLKHTPGLGDVYIAAEQRLERALCKRFRLPYPFPACVKEADEVMLASEMRSLMPALYEIWPVDAPDDAPEPRCWAPRLAKTKFMATYRELFLGEEK